MKIRLIILLLACNVIQASSNQGELGRSIFAWLDPKVSFHRCIDRTMFHSWRLRRFLLQVGKSHQLAFVQQHLGDKRKQSDLHDLRDLEDAVQDLLAARRNVIESAQRASADRIFRQQCEAMGKVCRVEQNKQKRRNRRNHNWSSR